MCGNTDRFESGLNSGVNGFRHFGVLEATPDFVFKQCAHFQKSFLQIRFDHFVSLFFLDL